MSGILWLLQSTCMPMHTRSLSHMISIIALCPIILKVSACPVYNEISILGYRLDAIYYCLNRFMGTKVIYIEGEQRRQSLCRVTYTTRLLSGDMVHTGAVITYYPCHYHVHKAI